MSLEALPVVGERRIAVRVTADALRQIRGGSPWLYDGSITSTSHEGAAGDLAVIFDGKRKFAAIGLWDPSSPIRVKVLHAGAPVAIDAACWRGRLEVALERRRGLIDDDATTAFRCVHGENDAFPGLVVDRYDRTLVVKLYSPAWFPHLRLVVEQLVALVDPERVVVRLGRGVASGETFGLRDGDTVVGRPPATPIRFLERGLLMEADVVRGQKTGHFLDQRDNRALVGAIADGAHVLDVFASTGGFSLAAAAGGAASVHLVDQSAPALDAAERNFALNRRRVQRCAVRRTVGDAFAVLEQLGRHDERYDVVVIDPPSFASNQAAVPRAVAAYARLARLGLPLVRPGGTFVQASCSSRVGADQLGAAVLDAARSLGLDVHVTRRTGHPVDHPIGFEHGEYLKALFLAVRG
ncbi:MAG: class I SAM-dependent rRNA methyltransferase [Ilumatobacter sp.]|uniref:class I SAM-dependent rRNA methyltransferase n=1 Tax=Ilumatobacter sp. TaxID=1967498 RepID=UPI00262B0981|nr:class I SAM-dependent rRNA methyltransferase [Ilumatobacter sp.]MDJ0769870.1 class I SAM-dependent rRNA methyltransferase [Ilumatobacter sp.]